MYQRKHHKRFCRRSGKSTALLVSLLLLLTVTVSGTIAFLMDSDGPLYNLFNPSQITTYVDETVSENIKSDVKIQNTGDTDAWIRAAVVFTWQDKDGNVYGQAPVENADYTINWGNNWVIGDDGFFYWPSPVTANNGKTGNLIEYCTVLRSKTVGTGADAVTYYLTVEIIGSGIQNKPANVFETEWASSGLTVDDSNTDPMMWTLSKEVRE